MQPLVTRYEICMALSFKDYINTIEFKDYITTKKAYTKSTCYRWKNFKSKKVSDFSQFSGFTLSDIVIYFYDFKQKADKKRDDNKSNIVKKIFNLG